MSSSRAYPGILPISYHNGKVRKKAQIMAIPFLNQFVQAVWPGTPTELWAGFMSNGSENEDTVTSSSTIRFHEIGYFGTEAGPRGLPAPNSDTSEPNYWFRFHNHAKVIELLGRPACMNDGCWKASNDGLRDQVAVGLVAMRYGHYEGLQRLLRPEARASNPSSFWAVVTTFMAWSAGDGGARTVINRHAADLANIPEEQKWNTLITLYAQDLLSNTVRPGASSHGNPFYSLIRTQQKIAVGSSVYETNTVDECLARGSTGGPVPSIQASELRVSPTSFTQAPQPTQIPTVSRAVQNSEPVEHIEDSGKEQHDDTIINEDISVQITEYTRTIAYPIIGLAVLGLLYAGYKYVKSRQSITPQLAVAQNPKKRRKSKKIVLRY